MRAPDKSICPSLRRQLLRLPVRGSLPHLLVAAVLATLIGCIPWAVTPMRTRIVTAMSDTTAPALLFMPGMGDSITVFEANGMLDSLHAAGLDAEFVACNAHFGYYAKRTLFERVWGDAMHPAMLRGHETVWFVGNSMGGLGSLLYAWNARIRTIHHDTLHPTIGTAPKGCTLSNPSPLKRYSSVGRLSKTLSTSRNSSVPTRPNVFSNP